MRMRRVAAVLIPTLAAAAVAIARPDGEEESNGAQAAGGLAEAPEPVRAAVSRLVGDGELTEYERSEEAGVVHHEVGWSGAQGAATVVLTEAGETIALERAIDDAQLPAAVRAAVAARHAGAEIVEAEAITLHYFEVTVRVDGAEHELEVLASGLLDDDLDDDDDDDEEDDDDDDDDQDGHPDDDAR